jgi:hypothetical protein
MRRVADQDAVTGPPAGQRQPRDVARRVLDALQIGGDHGGGRRAEEQIDEGVGGLQRRLLVCVQKPTVVEGGSVGGAHHRRPLLPVHLAHRIEDAHAHGHDASPPLTPVGKSRSDAERPELTRSVAHSCVV